MVVVYIDSPSSMYNNTMEYYKKNCSKSYLLGLYIVLVVTQVTDSSTAITALSDETTVDGTTIGATTGATKTNGDSALSSTVLGKNAITDRSVSSSSESVTTNTTPGKTESKTDNGITRSTTTNPSTSIITTQTPTAETVDKNTASTLITTSTPTHTTNPTLQPHTLTNTTLPLTSSDTTTQTQSHNSSTARSTEVETPTEPSTYTVNTLETTMVSGATSEKMTTQATTKQCEKPEVTFTNGKIYLNKTTIVFGCYEGYVLEGKRVGNCLENGAWSVETPRCVYNHSRESEDWKVVFIDHMSWYGTCHYRDMDYIFSFNINSVSTKHDLVDAELTDDQASVTLIGHKSKNSTIIFMTKEVKKPNDWIKDTSFQLEGHILDKNNSELRFQGYASTKDATSLVVMKPEVGKTLSAIDGGEKKALIIALSIILTSTLILALSLLAYHMLKKRGFVGGHQGHSTLTSFENPVYEFENTINNSLASES